MRGWRKLLNAFCLPITLEVLPRRYLAAGLGVLHGVPLGFLWGLERGLGGWLVVFSVLAAVSLGWELWALWAGGRVRGLGGSLNDVWRVYLGGREGEEGEVVEVVSYMDCVWFVLVRVGRGRGGRFSLVVWKGGQAGGEVHKLRLWMRQRRGG